MSKEQQTELVKYLKNAGSVLVAFSGGVDSCLLSYLAKQSLAERMAAVTVRSLYTPKWEIEESIDFTKKYDIRHEIIDLQIPQEIINNPKDRCYLCKKEIFSKIIKRAKELGMNMVVDGSNHDDLKDYRPGMKALKELAIKSPMLELGITKSQIRSMSKRLNLVSWDKPSCACLLSRLPYDTKITPEELERISAGEIALKRYGIVGARLRSHGNIARVEIPEKYFTTILQESIRKELSLRIKDLGYTYVVIDLDSFVSGSMNRTIREK